MTVAVESIKPIAGRGSLRAFATITIGELRIHGVRIIQQPGQSAWVSLPQREVPGESGGKARYFPIIEVLDEGLKNEISVAVLAAYHASPGSNRSQVPQYPAVAVR